MSCKPKLHMLEESLEDGFSGQTWVFQWPTCRDPESYNSSDDTRHYAMTTKWEIVTCKLCLRRRE